MKKILFFGAVLIAPYVTHILAQTPNFTPGEIRQKLNKLNVLGTVLYVAAHPDDENTRLITYYANDKLMRTGYLAATRGDGGQNLIGSEIREGLGVIRTQELLAARRTDGGRQFFSRANDFGYSKNPEETFTIWDRDEVLADFVWVVRKFKPDVIITRFNSEGRNHGHHTASAILAKEVFEIAGDPNVFPEQLDYVEPWKPRKIFWNTGWWWFRNGQDTTGLTTINMGTYNPLLGASYGEIAARSRSMHKSQSFGSSGSRGDQIEYLKQWGGSETATPFEDIDTSWGRVEGSEEVEFYINKAIDEYDPSKPWQIAESLVLARKSLVGLKDDFWRDVKNQELEELILSVSGMYLSLGADADNYSPGDSISIQFEAVNRSPLEVSLSAVKFNKWPNPVELKTNLILNKPFITEMNFTIPLGTDYSTPYWLKEPSSLGMYTVNDQEMRGIPENSPPFVGEVSINVGEELMKITVPIKYRYTDPIDGEVIKPVSVGPPVMMNINASVLVFGSSDPKSVEVRVIAGRNEVSGELKLDLPTGWKSSPQSTDFNLQRKGEEQVFIFNVSPPKKASVGELKATATIEQKNYSKGKMVIEYDHIPKQTIYPESVVKIVRLDLKKSGNLIGYIVGAGDAIPENLEQIGYQVDILQKDQVVAENLRKYDAVILGVRAFNKLDWLSYKNEELFEYVKIGGTVVVQYTTSYDLVTKDVAPYHLQISRDRISVEKAPIEFLVPDHPVLNSPNKITQKDFDGWVQERGLYFSDKWAEEFQPILRGNDPGESPKSGGLLVAKYGEGYYVYSGYSWFRELPAGVPGAYRIFVNLISLGND